MGLAAQQPDGGGVRDDEPFDDLMRGYTRRLMTFRVRERLRRYVAGPTASERPHPTGWCAENENPGRRGGWRHRPSRGGKHASASHS